MSDQPAAPVNTLRIDRDAATGGSAGGSADTRTRSMRRTPRRRTITRGVLIVVFVMIIIAIISSITSQPHAVATATATRMYLSQGNQVLIASGYVVAQRKASVASKGTGRLVALNVIEGDRVAANQILARIESGDVDAALAQADAALAQSKAALLQAEAEARDAAAAWRRAQALIERGAIPQSEVDAVEARHARAEAGVTFARANIRAAEAALRAAAVQVENTYIRAPFTGTVLTKNADVGEVVAPFGAAANARGAVLTIADMSSLEVEADVSESQIQNVRVGQPCEIVLDAYPDQRYPARVSRIVPTADRSKATVLTKIRFEQLDDRVLPEMSAKVGFLSQEPSRDADAQRPRTVIHPDAIRTREGATQVFVVTGGVARLRTVRLGATLGTMREVLEGITPGDVVVLAPPEDLADGDAVTVEHK